eukprot:10045648-Ditylum_brightwellii.AAC.1
MASSNLIFTSWLDVVTENQSLKKYNGAMKETLSDLTSPGTNGLEMIKKMRGLVALSRASGRKGLILLIHQMEEIGSLIPILEELSKTVVLLRFKDNVVPVTINESSLLETTEEKVLTIDFLAALNDEDEVFKEMESTTLTIKIKVCNSIVLPPWLAK